VVEDPGYMIQEYNVVRIWQGGENIIKLKPSNVRDIVENELQMIELAGFHSALPMRNGSKEKMYKTQQAKKYLT